MENNTWVLPPTELKWRELHSGSLSIADRPFDARTEIASSVTQLIGQTPMAYIDKVAGGLPGRVAVKLETFEPLGSVKDRTALALVEEMEMKGVITPGKSTLLEITSGNTGIGLAFIAAAKGYRLKCVMPDVASLERRILMLALGAEVILTAKEKGFEGILSQTEEMLKEDPSLVFTKQFESAANPWVHQLTTGPEIWTQTQGKVDVFLAGVGTGGTITGVGNFLKGKRADIQVYALEPEESPFLSTGKSGKHGIDGIGAGLQVPTLDPAVLDGILTVKTEEAQNMARRLALEEGIFAGPSSGAAVAAAIQVATRPESQGKLIVTLLPSYGERYLSTPVYQEYTDRAKALPIHYPPPRKQGATYTFIPPIPEKKAQKADVVAAAGASEALNRISGNNEEALTSTAVQ